MKTPIVAIIGRPNVGKSTFFNTLIGRNLSIVDPTPGVTRDRIIQRAEWSGVEFNLVDTGGIDFDDTCAFNTHIREQVDIAISLADVVVMLTDGVAGVHPHDIEIATLLRRAKKSVVLAVNKIDNDAREHTVHDFYQLKIGDPIGISCTQKLGLGDLLDEVVFHFKKAKPTPENLDEVQDEDSKIYKIAIVGKPNAGKSSIINKILGTNRVMVSEIAGTTRDTIDTQITHEEQQYIITDTAGIRRKRSVEVQTIEHYSVLRAIATIRNSDVVVLVVDATHGLTEQDVRLLGYAHEDGKPSVVCINKWDLALKQGSQYAVLPPKHDNTGLMNAYTKQLARDLAFMSYFKPIFISALTGQRIGEVLGATKFVLEKTATRITTGTLNALIGGFVATTPPPMHLGKRPKLLYSTQVSTHPPTFALFVSNREAIKSTYLRYLENCLRKSVDLTGTPIKFILKSKSEK